MNTLFRIALLLSFVPGLSFAAPSRAGFAPVGVREIQEDEVTFKYSSSDGTIELNCTHVFDAPELHDWDVVCGKGTKLVKQFRVHFLARQYKSRNGTQSAFEVLYWVIDRNQPARAFSSTSSWIQFKNFSSLEKMSFSQGIENDYAYLQLDFKPQK
jgi:hypothetical protein